MAIYCKTIGNMVLTHIVASLVTNDSKKRWVRVAKPIIIVKYREVSLKLKVFQQTISLMGL